MRNIYDYEKGDLQGLCAALRELDLSTTISDQLGDIDADWERWKNAFLTEVSKYIPKKRLLKKSKSVTMVE